MCILRCDYGNLEEYQLVHSFCVIFPHHISFRYLSLQMLCSKEYNIWHCRTNSIQIRTQTLILKKVSYNFCFLVLIKLNRLYLVDQFLCTTRFLIKQTILTSRICNDFFCVKSRIRFIQKLEFENTHPKEKEVILV